MNNFINNICKQFNIAGEFYLCEPITNGHINSTYHVVYLENNKPKEYVLQKINKHVFKDPVSLMQNIFLTTNHIREKLKTSNTKTESLHFYFTNQGLNFYVDENNEYWRLMNYVSNSKAVNETRNLKILEETGLAFGEFQQQLSDLNAELLSETIPNFHNTQDRFDKFKAILQINSGNRRDETLQEIQDYLQFEEIATTMHKMLLQNQLPLRVTHNDTKCNNVLFDKNSNKRLCVIDLDTVMPGLMGFDFGDAIRFAANTCKEDETNLEKVTIDLKKYEAFTKGFISAVRNSVTENEKNTLALGALTMTIECGLRFLTDYLDGDKYFKISYPKHNLDRARCQLKLAKDIYKNLNLLQNMVEECYLLNQDKKHEL